MKTYSSLPHVQPLPELSSVITTAPRVIGRFFIRGEIGRGSNGVVYAAHDPILDREVAIKAIPLSHDIAYRAQVEANFINEAKAAARLNHPNIVTVFDAGKSDHLAYIAMERLRGEDLHDVIARGERMGWRQVTHLMTRVADAVHFAHKRGLIHRDIKPSNIFLLRDGKPKVLDFGVAVMTMGPAGSAHQRQLIGTPNYMSPEQARGERIDARTDVFSLGAILYELLSGVRAFDGNNIDSILAEVISGDPVPLNLLRPDLPQALVGVVTRALEKDLDTRYQTAGELRNQLAICAGRPSPTRLKSSNRPRADVRPRGRKLNTPRQLFASALRLAQTVSPRALAGISLGLFVFAVAAVLINKIAQPNDTPQPASIQPQPAALDPIALDPIALDPIALVPTRPLAQPQGVQPLLSGDPTDTSGPNESPVIDDQPPPEPQATPTEAAKPAARAPKAPAPRRASRAPTPTPAADGIVALAVAPWGEVYIDGVSQGVSPPVNQLSLAPGVYLIEIRNGRAVPFVARIEIKSGKTLALKHRF